MDERTGNTHKLKQSPPRKCDSQFPDSSSSMSLPSELPDVRNWFSSYVYESPSLGSLDGIGDSLIRPNEPEISGFLIGDANTKFEDYRGNVSPVSSQSELQLSEAADIRNWFSSYVYESPALSCDLREYQSEESHHGKEESVDENSSKDKELREPKKHGSDVGGGEIENSDWLVTNKSFLAIEAQVQSISKEPSGFTISSFAHLLLEQLMVADSSQSSPQLSEPPPISNWFSSYVYESPELSVDEFSESSFKVKVVNRDGSAIEEENGDSTDRNGACRNVALNKSFTSDTKQVIQPQIEEHDELLPEVIPWKDQSEHVVLHRCQHPAEEMFLKKSDTGTREKLKQSFLEEQYEGLLDPSLVNQTVIRKSTSKSPDKGSEEENTDSNGFVSVRKRDNRGTIADEENYTRRPASNLGKCSNTKQTVECQFKEHNELTHTDMISRKDLKDHAFADHGKHPPEVATLNNIETDTGEKLKQKFSGEHYTGLLHSSLVNQIAMRKSTSESSDKGSEGGNTDSNGFISVRKRGSRGTIANDENSPRSSVGSSRKCLTAKENAPVMSTEQGPNRRPLSETNNFPSHPDIPEKAGKWKCPQRNKPNLGPPMKQLRLEKWIQLVRM